MVKRKYLILLFWTLITPQKVYPSAWLLSPRTWAYYYTFEDVIDFGNDIIKGKKAEFNYLKNLGSRIVNLERVKIEVSNDKRLTQTAKAHIIYTTDKLLAILRDQYNKNYNHYPKECYSHTIEYGFKDSITLGTSIYKKINANYIDQEFSDKTLSELSNFRLSIPREFTYVSFNNFARVKLWQSKNYIISFQPKFSIIHTDYKPDKVLYANELRLLLGNSNVNPKNNITIFHNLEFAYLVRNLIPKETITCELSQGFKFRNGIQLIFQHNLQANKVNSLLYKKTLREQFSIAKTFNLYSSNMRKTEFTLQIGYFSDITIKRKRKFAEGILTSLWLKI